MTTELSYRNEGANVYAQDGTLVCIAVDPLDAEILAGLLRWKVDVQPESTPEPDPWPTEPLIAAEGRLWFRQEDGDYLDKDGTVRGEGRHTFAGPVVPVTVVPTAPLPVLWSALEQWLNNGLSTATEDMDRLVGAVVGLREQIEELGLEPEPEPPVGTTIIDNRGVTWTHTEPGLWVTGTGAQGRYNNIVSNFGPVARSRQGQFLGCESPELEALKRARR